MPFSLPPLNRRRWIQGAAASAVSATAGAAASPNDEVWALLSDTHLAEDPGTVKKGVNMAANLKRTVAQVLKVGQKPHGVMINGDCAYLDGQEGDYLALGKALQPLRDHAVQVHLTLGNHDDRTKFRAALSGPRDEPPLEQKHVALLSSAKMNWVLLDTLDVVNEVPGLLGKQQLGWLNRTLRNAPNKPTAVMMHHNPGPFEIEGNKVSGLVDTKPLFDVLARHQKKVFALFYGHTHNWSVSRDEATGIHLVNLPPVAYTFKKERPNGWVVARMGQVGLELELKSLNPNHPEHREKVLLEV
jgi:hypothetical protein